MNIGIERIAVALEAIVEVVKKGGADDKPPQEVDVNDSMGSCPECESVEVQQHGRYPNAIFKCDKCAYIWVNDPDSLFND